ncbi:MULTISPECIES: ATP-binding protein [Streptomyces]|uniref:ATP-binding protein n=1 Tax=Streptomyces cyaneofuscatus TaxID=66883 RepID=A0ABZ1F1G7_9ACTN|nr:ATP-binding protein [Streptomyces cyaneofuscatus]WSB10110.1 ATP-binding protein [Streptomyces cyaneofuscatus]WSD46357.1 ATP-binding protein [Streptomyces cyaneofuscatus]WTA89734.1 ATP-binding protein [Streptomyces cyaneofuscatus]
MIGVIDTEGDCAEWSFPAEPGSVRSARHAVRDALDCWGLDVAVGDLTVLLVSELVTNSLRYASGPIGVRLERSHPDAGSNGSGELTGDFSIDLRLDADRPPATPGLLVEVSDPLPDPPTERRAGPDDEGGRGLQLVACSARRWGTRRGKSGKTVWFELALPG